MIDSSISNAIYFAGKVNILTYKLLIPNKVEVIYNVHYMGRLKGCSIKSLYACSM